MADLLELRGRDETARLGAWFAKAWDHECTTVREENQRARWKAWRIGKTVRARSPSLVRTLFSGFGWRYLSLGLLKLIGDSLMFSGPVLLGYLVSFVASYKDAADAAEGEEVEREEAWHGWLYAGGLVLGVLLNAICSTQYTFAIRRCGLHIRAVVVQGVYRKALHISNTARRAFSAGQITNIMSTDTDRVCDIVISVHELWSLPVQIGLALFLLYREVGWSLLGGLAVVILLIPFNAFLTHRINKVSQAMMRFKDERLSLLDELIRHIRTIKFLGLERRFTRSVLAVREKEMGQLATRKYLDALCVYCWATTPILVSLATFSCYSYLAGGVLTSAKVFSSLALFNILIRPLNSLPWVINGLVEGRVSALRVYAFLAAHERGQGEDDDLEDEQPALDWHVKSPQSQSPVPDEQKQEPTQEHDVAKCAICVEGSFDYVLAKPEKAVAASPTADDASETAMLSIEVQPSSSSSGHALSDLSLHVLAGECIGVHGLVGSGKSTLLLGMLGELCPSRREAKAGTLAAGEGRRIVGKVAYVSQETWLPNGTVRETILFHTPYEPVRYKAVLEACALTDDLLTLPSGDLTEVGEGGINLSGGQQMRLQLARACYSRAHVVLLDDPLSSVDAHVGAHLLRHVLGRHGILRDAARILVTHHVDQVRPHCDRVWTMASGRVVKDERVERDEEQERLSLERLANEAASAVSSPAAATPSLLVDDKAAVAAEEAAEAALRERGFLTVAELRARGSIRSRVLRSYLAFVGWTLCVVIVLSMFLMQGTRNATDWWLSYWGQHSDDADTDAKSAHYYLIIFAILAAANSFAALFRAFIFAWGGLRAARELFRSLLHAVVRAPISWFDANSVGRVLNRFSSDVNSIDESIPFAANIFLAQLFMLVGSLVVIATVVPAVLLILPILAFVYFRIQRNYRSVSRELRRLDATSRSPLYANFSETLSGCAVVRAFGMERVFESRNTLILDRNQQCQLASIGMSNWLNLRLQCIGCSMITLVALLACVACLYPLGWLQHLINPSLIGLGIAYALPLTDNLNGLIGSATDTEKEIISVERTVEYIGVRPEDEDERAPSPDEEEEEEREEEATPRRRKHHVGINEDLESALLPVTSSFSPMELATRSPLVDLPPSWPSRGCVEFSHVGLSYRAGLEPALRDVSFLIRAGERVGIVGRTGGGKSSLFQALFRMRPIQSGRILVDDVDLARVSRHDVRTRLAIIPQAPVLFHGTLRSNLLPYDDEARPSVSDDEVWRALAQCHMEAKVRAMPGGLDTILSEATRLSVGERQLLCFSRALLKKASVIVLDEATASVDQATDAAISELTLSLAATVILIAHRTSSVLPMDRVLVMDAGRLVEQGSPKQLCEDPSSRFAQLVAQARSNQAPSIDLEPQQLQQDADAAPTE